MIIRKLLLPLRPIVRHYRRQRAITHLATLLQLNSPRAQLVHRALVSAISGQILPDEQNILNAIEQRRSELLRRKEPIEVIDYGAGDSESTRTQAQMRNGITQMSTVADITGASKSELWARMLFAIVREFKPSACLELGTCVGISASYQAAALKLNGSGQLITLEGSPAVASVANETVRQLHFSEMVEIITGPFFTTYKDALKTLKCVDYIFIDGHHDEKATLEYFAQARPFLTQNAIIVFDDISWSRGMATAWKTIQSQNGIATWVDMQTFGVCIFDEAIMKPEFTLTLRL